MQTSHDAKLVLMTCLLNQDEKSYKKYENLDQSTLTIYFYSILIQDS